MTTREKIQMLEDVELVRRKNIIEEAMNCEKDMLSGFNKSAKDIEVEAEVVSPTGGEHYLDYNDFPEGHYEQDMLSGFNKSLKDIEVEVEPLNLFPASGEVIDKAADRKATPVFSGVLKYFPNALKEVSKCSQAGNDQHHPDKPLHWDMEKSKDEYDALTRHLIDHTINPIDDDGMLHLTKVAWRALAGLERYLTNKL